MCPDCSDEIDSMGVGKNLKGFSNRLGTGCKAEEASLGDSGELADLVKSTNMPKLVLNSGKNSKKGWSWYRTPSTEAVEGKDPSPFEIWRKFVRTTTGHGFARIVDTNEHWQLRVFWAIVVLLLVAGLLISVFIISYESLVVRGLQREFIVQYNNTMYLPDIHICDTSLFSRSALECILESLHRTFNLLQVFFNALFLCLAAMGFNKTMGSYLALTLSPMLASRSLRKDMKRRQELEIIYNVLMENRTIHDVYERATLKYNVFSI